MSERVKRHWPVALLVTILLAALGWTWSGASAAATMSERVERHEQDIRALKADQAEIRSRVLDKLIEIDNRLTVVQTEQRILHRGQVK